MFEDSLFATNETRTPQRRLAAIVSFAIQGVCLGMLVLVPLFYTDALPLGALKRFVEQIPPPPGRAAHPPAPPHRPAQPTPTNIVNGQIVAPITIPRNTPHIVDNMEPAAPGDNGNGVVGMPEGLGRTSPEMNRIIAATMPTVAPPMNITTPRSVTLSRGVTEGMLIHKITPVYPRLAINIRQQGTVLLQATIGRDGTIQNLHAVSGPPFLVPAALDAVRQWRYRPYLLNNEPVEVETQITVNFTLGG